ncbi:MAG TPA: hypothetical protein VM737_09745 [Gemmatimonadota bacterium]|nr:hypothetical protein [Gemmatimonadota bacterium]
MLLWLAVVCADEPADPIPFPAPEIDSLARTTPEEVQAELEMLGFEITDLAIYLEANPRRAFADSIDPRLVLTSAEGALAATRVALQAHDTTAAVDSLSIAAGRIERVKRLLGVAEELGVEADPAEATPDSLP